MRRRRLAIVGVIFLVSLSFLMLIAIVLLIIRSLTLESEISNLKKEIGVYQQEQSQTQEETLEQEKSNPEHDNSSPDSNGPTENKTRKKYTLQGSLFLLGKDREFSIEVGSMAKMSEDNKLNGGGGYVGLKLVDENLDMNFGLPYESPSRKYIDKKLIVTNNELGSTYRVTQSDGSVFYTNRFDEYIEDISYCSPSTGTSDDCASPFLGENTEDTSGDSNSFVVTCNLTTKAGLENCDEVVKTINFE